MAPVDSSALMANLPNLERQMLHIKTKEECRLGHETVEVWCIELPSKHAEGILKMIKETIPGQNDVDLQHLRRFARPKFIPEHVVGQRDLVKEMHAVPRTWDASPQTVLQIPGTSAWEWSNPRRERLASKPTTLYLLVCPARLIPLQDLHKLLLEHTPFASSPDSWAYPLEIKKVVVPLLPPISNEQADEWSIKYWPTFYRKTNPFGAHPATIAKAESELHTPLPNNISVAEAMDMADQAAEGTASQGHGTHVGCVVIERVEDRTNIIAVAGDARFKPLRADSPVTKSDRCSQGNPACHAVMRAIGMVARKRLRCASQPVARAADKASHTLETAHIDQTVRDGFFLDQPLTSLEQKYYEDDNLKPDGYLCLKLEFFVTHEPCVMCSMALVHSRVGRVIFRERMPKSGGLTAETPSNVTGPVGLGYGLCWRKELNWQFMCWEYTTDPPPSLSDTTCQSLYSTFCQAVDPMPNGTPCNGVSDDEEKQRQQNGTLTVTEKYTAPIVHHRRRKKQHQYTDTSTPPDDSEQPESQCMTSANPNVSSFASIHV